MLGGAGLLGALSVAGCAATAATFNPAVDGWLSDLAVAVGATVIADGMNTGLKDFFESWTNPVQATIQSRANTTIYSAYYDLLACHPRPPVVLGGILQAVDHPDPMTDRMIACVNGGKQSAVFESWAWQALSMYIHTLTDGLTGADLNRLQELCILSLLPSAVKPNVGRSPDKTVGWMTYDSSNGSVEIAFAVQPDGGKAAFVTAQGIPDDDNNPTRAQFTLPTQAVTV